MRLNISVTGGRGAQVPQQLNIDGIDARFIGKSEQMQWQMREGGVNSTATSTYSYIIVPLRQGDFNIPGDPDRCRREDRYDFRAHLSVSGGRGTFRFCLPFPFRKARKANNQLFASSSGATRPRSPAISARRIENCLRRFDHSEEDRLCRRGRSG